ncbi:FAD-binding and (Fe-S)-binding domain-containing protein [Actinomadura macra]|uniref:FAD-binding and (Fe-S)-binding domain-containing protein n=1 Tax=Actinomadura macra TaxID=46164 RepID=UPI00083149C1|nr:FAD-binding and (Fe-S)-binding domain-containing protein [Actinomadura macra]
MTASIDPRLLAERARRLGIGEIDTSPRARAEYSSDASNYRVPPLGIIHPRDAGEVTAAVDLAKELSIPLTARGGGTSVAGNSIGPGVVLDFSRHFNAVLDVDPDARTALVQPGATLDSITAAAAKYGLRYGPDPSTHSRATIGGSLGNNACGSRALAYGRCADNVSRLQVVTGTGTLLTARPLGRGGLASLALPEGDQLDALVRGNLATIRTEFGRFRRQVSGYSLEHLLPEQDTDLARFLVGTEGTLGIAVEATVTLVEQPAATALVILGYPDIVAAATAAPALLALDPIAIEGLDGLIVAALRQARGESAVPALPKGGAWLFLEFGGESVAQARATAAEAVGAGGCIDSLVVDGEQAARLWRIREDGAGLGGRTATGEPAWPGWEDSAVPPEHLADYLRDLQKLMAEHRVDGLMYGHFGEGCVHARFNFPLADRKAGLREFVESAADLVAGYGGSMSGEHGDGRARSELLARMYSPTALDLFAQVKRIFDPANVLNPGIIVDPLPLDHDLRLPQALPLTTRGGFALTSDGGSFTAAVHRCTGVGKCRADNTVSGGVMCPSYLATRDEKDSTRGRARVLQELANGQLISTAWRSPEVADALDLCLSCKGCASDCPTGIDMATYKAEVLYHRYRRRIRPLSHYSLGWLPRWAGLAVAPRLINSLMRVPLVARLAKRLGGIDHRRAIPALAEQTFRRTTSGTLAGRGTGTPVLLWIDTFTNHLSPHVGEAAVRVLQDAGYQPVLTNSRACCGLTWITTGQLDGARRQLRRSLDALGEAIRHGHPIVVLEPSCAAVFRQDLPELLPDDPRAERVAGQTRTLAELLNATPGWQPPDLTTLRGLAQPHCHQHAVLGWGEDAKLLHRAGAHISPLAGCCGLAGNFGMEKGHYETSVKVAETALLPGLESILPTDVVLADGYSCRTQIAQLGEHTALHLAEVLDPAADRQ